MLSLFDKKTLTVSQGHRGRPAARHIDRRWMKFRTGSLPNHMATIAMAAAHGIGSAANAAKDTALNSVPDAYRTKRKQGYGGTPHDEAW